MEASRQKLKAKWKHQGKMGKMEASRQNGSIKAKWKHQGKMEPRSNTRSH
jgi:hypothetical protein